MRLLNAWIEKLSLVCAVLAGALLAASILVITWMVAYRAMGYQNSWELETSIDMMVAAVFLGSPYTLRTKGHVGMELLESVLSDRGRCNLALVSHSVGLFVCLYLAWAGFNMTIEAYHSGEHSLGVWQALVWPRYAAMPVGMILTALQYFVEMQKTLGSGWAPLGKRGSP